MVSARIPVATVDAIDEWARRNETTRSGAIALLVELGLIREDEIDALGAAARCPRGSRIKSD